ncbi:MAG: hypothetical protein AAB620_00035 [Patescibacteria group bacterium]
MSIKNKKIIIAVGLGLVCLASLASFSLALAADPPTTDFMQLKYPDWFNLQPNMKLTDLVIVIFRAFLVVGGIAAFIIIVVGGFRYLTSIGNPGIMSDARSQIFSALLGLTLLLGTYLILNTINPELVALKEPELAGIEAPEIDTSDIPYGQLGSTAAAIITITKPTNAKLIVASGATAPATMTYSGITITADPVDQTITITDTSTGAKLGDVALKDGAKMDVTVYRSDGTDIGVKLSVGTGYSSEAVGGIAILAEAEVKETSVQILKGQKIDWLAFENAITSKTADVPITADIKGWKIPLGTLKINLKDKNADFTVAGKSLGTMPIQDKADIEKTLSISLDSQPGKEQSILLKLTLRMGNIGICEGVSPTTDYDVIVSKGSINDKDKRCFKLNDAKPWKVAPFDIDGFFINKPSANAAVMFYEKADFAGRRICLKSNTFITKCRLEDKGLLGIDTQWKNNINSLKIIPASECTQPGLTLDSNSAPTNADKNKCH